MDCRIFTLLALIIVLSATSYAYAQNASGKAECRKTIDSAHIKIPETVLAQLRPIGLAREAILSSAVATSIPESRGCWSGAAGDFDGQIVSIGFAQWNYGQGSLQPLLRRFREAFSSKELFQSQVQILMPNFGKTVLSEGCTRQALTKDCVEFLKDQQLGNGRLKPDFAAELNTLFESDLMTQIQIDAFVRLLTSVSSDLARVFRGIEITATRVKWAIDTKIQQGGFPGDGDIERIRSRWKTLNDQERKSALLSVLKWYEGLCGSLDQDGVKYDCQYNLRAWQPLIAQGKLPDEMQDLILLSFLRSRTAATKSGLYQANTFQRRVKVAIGVGSVHGAR